MEPVLSNEQSSLTADSASLQPARPSAVRTEDRKKFVVRRDVQAKSHTDLLATMAKVEAALKLVATDLDAIQNAIQWRAFTSEAFEGFREVLTKAKAALGTQENRLHGTRGVDKHIPAVVDGAFIPEVIQKVQFLEVEIFCLQARHRKLEALSDAKHFQDTLTQSKNMLPLLALQPNDAASISAFRQLVDAHIKECLDCIDSDLYPLIAKGTEQACDECITALRKVEIERLKNTPERHKLQATKELQLEKLMVARSMMDMQDDEIKQRLAGKARICNALIQHLERELQRKRFQIKSLTSRVVAADYGAWLKPGDENLIVGKDVDEHEYKKLQEAISYDWAFWTHAPGKNWYALGWYPQTGALGLALEADVGQSIHGLLLKLKRLIVDVSQGGAISSAEVQGNLRHYDGCVVALEKALDGYIDKICKTPQDALTQPLLDYAYGLNWGLREARALVKLGSKCTGESSLAVFNAMNGIQKYYRSLQNESAVTRMVRFYYSVEDMEEAEKKVPLLKDTAFTIFLRRAAEYMHEMHANKDHLLLELSREEALVPSMILTGISMDTLYGKGESQEGLAHIVLQYLLKRMMQFVFLPSPSHDMELELVLHVIRKNYDEKYYQSLFEFDGLGRIFGRYDTLCESKRLDAEKGIEPALKIADLAFRAQQEDFDVLAYVEAWQRLFEYARLKQGDAHECMYNVLTAWLDAAAIKHHYDVMCPAVATTDIEAWGSEEPELFLAKLDSAGKDTQLVFNAVVLRIVGACLYAQDAIEQVVAQQKLVTLLDTPEYVQHIDALSSDIKLLIAENAIKKINSTGRREDKGLELVFKEEQFLLDGPFHEFFANSFLSLDQAATQMALYRLIQQQGENGLLASRYKAKWGSQYERWIEGYDAFVKGNPLAQLIN